MGLHFPELTMLPLERYARLLTRDQFDDAMERIGVFRAQLAGRVVWNVSSTAVGGGVAEMVRSILAYARGAGVDARWAVIEGTPEFFRLTKRIHNAIHGNPGDGSPLGDAERELFEHVNATAAAELAALVRPHDIVIVHDPQPAAMIPSLVDRGAHVIWRCHIGHDQVNLEVEQGWRFLAPYLRRADAYVFSRAAYVPTHHIDARRAHIIPPSIDPFSAKNEQLGARNILAILAQAAIIQPVPGVERDEATFAREDGTPSRIDHAVHATRDGIPPPASTPLIVQVSRWDRLKDPAGVLEGFARLDEAAVHGAHLVLAGPDVSGVTDDPEGEEVLHAITSQWHHLPDAVRRRVHLVTIPTLDVDENAVIVNALQRHATVIVQKSLNEGFGLTVTEAMWKARPVVASAVGGIQDQIDNGVQGLLIRDPRDLGAFAAALAQIFRDPDAAELMGKHGRSRVLQRYIALNSLLSYGGVIASLGEQARAREHLETHV